MAAWCTPTAGASACRAAFAATSSSAAGDNGPARERARRCSGTSSRRAGVLPWRWQRRCSTAPGSPRDRCEPAFARFGRGGIFAVGNAAAEAHPIVAEGISMAIQSAALLCERLIARPELRCAGTVSADVLRGVRNDYARAWRNNFSRRLFVAAAYAHLFMRPASDARCHRLAGTLSGAAHRGRPVDRQGGAVAAARARIRFVRGERTMTTLESMQGIFKAIFDLAPEAAGPEAVLEDLGIDSLSMIEVLFAVEDEFKIVMPPDPAALRGADEDRRRSRATTSTSSSLRSARQWPARKCRLETGCRHRDRRRFAARQRRRTRSSAISRAAVRASSGCPYLRRGVVKPSLDNLADTSAAP